MFFQSFQSLFPVECLHNLARTEALKEIFQYENSRLSNIITSAFIEENWIHYFKDTFIYDNGIVVDVSIYGAYTDTTWLKYYTTNYYYLAFPETYAFN